MLNSVYFHNLTLKMLMMGFHRKFCTSQLPKVTNSLLFKNPCLDLQQYIEVPLFKEEELCYEPNEEITTAALKVFTPSENNKIRRVIDTNNPEYFPLRDLPEVAFLGRSNAGKSSLLKAIFHAVPGLGVQTSRKPGHTKSLKFYEVGSYLRLVDMPGYGYRAPAWFTPSVIPYLKKRRNLIKTFFLIDIQESFHSWDDAALQMLKDLGIPFAVVLTKIDAVSDSMRFRNYLHLQNIIRNFTLEINTCFPQIFMVSAHTFEGIPYFLSFIAYITGSLSMKPENTAEMECVYLKK